MGSDSVSKAETPAVQHSKWKAAYGINLHKILCVPVIYGLMVWYNCFTPAAWIYLALHGSYGLLWVCKEYLFPDKNFQQPSSAGEAFGAFMFCNLAYWPIPWLLVAHARSVPHWWLCLATTIFCFGMFLMHGSDCQKYYTLKAAPGKLITIGFFKHVRHPNYLGEILLYMALAMLTYIPWGFISITTAILLLFVPNMKKIDRSLSRFPEFAEWESRSYLVIPFIY